MIAVLIEEECEGHKGHRNEGNKVDRVDTC